MTKMYPKRADAAEPADTCQAEVSGGGQGSGAVRKDAGSRPPIPGERALSLPADCDIRRLQRLRPFVRQSGDEWRRAWLLPGRKLLDYLIVYIADGHGSFTVDASTFAVGPGDLVWIPPDTYHEMEGFAPSMHCIYAHFDLLYDPARSNWDACIPGGTLSLEPWTGLMHPPLDDAVIGSWKGTLPVSNAAAIGGLLTALCVEHRRLAADAAVQIGGMMLQLVGLILRGLSPGRKSTPHAAQIQAALEFIREHADRDLHVGRLAAAVGLSGSHLRRLFRETVGKSPRAVHREARIRKACGMLVYNTRMNISEVAFALGFSTVHNFSRAFHQLTGTAPTAYRRGK